MNKTKFYTLLVLLCVAFFKSLLIRPSIPDVAILAVLGGVFAYLEQKRRDKDLEAYVARVQKLEQETDELKNKMSSIKLVQSMKPNALTFKS